MKDERATSPWRRSEKMEVGDEGMLDLGGASSAFFTLWAPNWRER